jgi:hypothetical protein
VKDLVYRLSYTTGFVYRKYQYTVHKVFCGLQNIHKQPCGSYFLFQCPQNDLLEPRTTRKSNESHDLAQAFVPFVVKTQGVAA